MNRDNDTAYFGNNLRAVQAVSTPNDLINTDDGRYNFSTWTFKLNGTIVRSGTSHLTPALRVQSGQPFGRTFLAGTANGVNYGTQRILAEPIGIAQAGQHRHPRPARREALQDRQSAPGCRCVLDIYNIGNSDAASNITWG